MPATRENRRSRTSRATLTVANMFGKGGKDNDDGADPVSAGVIKSGAPQTSSTTYSGQEGRPNRPVGGMHPGGVQALVKKDDDWNCGKRTYDDREIHSPCLHEGQEPVGSSG